MKRYDSYKDSGVEWMNEIPSNWGKSRIRMVGNLYGGLTGKKGNDFNDEDNLSNKPFVPFTNIFNNTYISKEHFQYVNVEEGENQNRVLKNDLLFLMSSESYEDLGKCSILLEEVEELYLNSFCKGYRVKDLKVYPLFLNYQLLGSLHKEMISIEGNGFTRINLRQDRLLDIPVFIPPLSEQQQIVSFLDTKTSLIDSLIDKTQEKIVLLKEKRTSLINEVVTKGLNPNVKMKDSSVEWIGEIPSHWSSIPLKYFLEKSKDSIRTGPFGSTLKSSDMIESGVRIYNQRTVYDEDFSSAEIFVSDEKYQTMKSFTVLNGDILISSRGTIGKMTIVPEGSDIGVLHPCLIRLRIDQKKMNKQFLWWYMNHSSLFLQSVKFESNSTTIDVIYSNVLSEVKFPVPTISEQEEIISFLSQKIGVVDKTISIEEKRIELLKEYRQSLISEAVTGKRKVA